MEESGEILALFKALADKSRLSIVGLLAGHERSVQELAAALELKEPTVSHHLAVLKKAALVRMRPDGNTHWYRLDHQMLETVNRQVFGAGYFSRLARRQGAARSDTPQWEAKILGDFLQGERLTEIPASRRKRWAVLKWLAQKFDPHESYSEAEVNRVIKRHHHDCATLRRELIAYRMLERERGIYRRCAESRWRSAE